MKKNKFLKLASGLLVLCLLTTCVISTTFAKYTTSGSANDTARVAKWGVELAVQTDATNGLATSYGTSVVSNNDEKLVAPGTAAELMEFSISGNPEVSVKLDFTFTDTQDVFVKKAGSNKYLNWVTANDTTDKFDVTEDYYPIEYTLTRNGNPLANGNLDAIVAYLETEVMGSYGAGSADWDAICGNYLITWAWDYDQADPNVGVNDKADTLLGNLIDGVDAGTDYGTDVSTKINFNLTITATQID